jgi:hypothetical protein
MNKYLRILILVVVLAAVVAAAYLAYKALAGRSRGEPPDSYEWLTVDEDYVPRNAIEEFIKDDAGQQGLLPIYLRNYGRNPLILRKFRGARFVGANESVLQMSFQGLGDWMVIDLKYRNEQERDIQRTILYVEISGQWQVGDSGRLMD